MYSCMLKRAFHTHCAEEVTSEVKCTMVSVLEYTRNVVTSVLMLSDAATTVFCKSSGFEPLSILTLFYPFYVFLYTSPQGFQHSNNGIEMEALHRRL